MQMYGGIDESHLLILFGVGSSPGGRQGKMECNLLFATHIAFHLVLFLLLTDALLL
jgi:hypothetical protein